MPFNKFLLCAAYGLLLTKSGSGEVTDSVNDVKRRQSLRRHDMLGQGPMSKEEAKLMRQLISKNALQLANESNDRRAQRGAISGSNRFLTVLAENSKANEAMLTNVPRRGRKVGRGASSSQDRRELAGMERKGSKKGSSKSKGGTKDEYVPGGGGPSVPELIPMVLEAFQDARMVQPPILTDPLAEDLAPGTQYAFANEPLFNVRLDSPSDKYYKTGTEGYFVNEAEMIATVSGTCTRTDPNVSNEMYVGRAYCQYSYHFLDDFGNVEAGIVAEGPIQIGDFSTLSITGGSGIFRGTVGTVILESGSINSGSNPVFVPDPLSDLPSSYIVSMFVFMDPLSLIGHQDIYP